MYSDGDPIRLWVVQVGACLHGGLIPSINHCSGHRRNDSDIVFASWSDPPTQSLDFLLVFDWPSLRLRPRASSLLRLRRGGA